MGNKTNIKPHTHEAQIKLIWKSDKLPFSGIKTNTEKKLQTQWDAPVSTACFLRTIKLFLLLHVRVQMAAYVCASRSGQKRAPTTNRWCCFPAKRGTFLDQLWKMAYRIIVAKVLKFASSNQVELILFFVATSRLENFAHFSPGPVRQHLHEPPRAKYWLNCQNMCITQMRFCSDHRTGQCNREMKF